MQGVESVCVVGKHGVGSRLGGCGGRDGEMEREGEHAVGCSLHQHRELHLGLATPLTTHQCGSHDAIQRWAVVASEPHHGPDFHNVAQARQDQALA